MEASRHELWPNRGELGTRLLAVEGYLDRTAPGWRDPVPPPPPPPPLSPIFGAAVQDSDVAKWDELCAVLGVTPGMARLFDSNDLGATVSAWPVGPLLLDRGVPSLVSFKTSPEAVLTPAFADAFRAYLASNRGTGVPLHIAWQHEHENPSKGISPERFTTGSAVVGGLVQEAKSADNLLTYGEIFMGYSWKAGRPVDLYNTPATLEVTDWIGIDDYLTRTDAGRREHWATGRSELWHPWISDNWGKEVWICEHGIPELAEDPDFKPSTLEEVQVDSIARGIPVRLYFNVVSTGISNGKDYLIDSSAASVAKCREHVLAGQTIPGGKL